MSVTSHLKDLLTKMGGTPKNGDSTSVLIDKIEDVYATGGGGGSDTGSNVLIANATWLLASNDPMRESFEELIHDHSGEDASYHGRFVLDKTWNEVKNAQSAIIRFESNETDVDMNGGRVFFNYPMSITIRINVAFVNEGIPYGYQVKCMGSTEDYNAFLPLYNGCPFDQVYFNWAADSENSYLSSGPLFETPSA